MLLKIILLGLFLNSASARELFIYDLYPELAQIPRLEILKESTVLHPLAQLQSKLFREHGNQDPGTPLLWIKRDDVTFGPLGGNKARKLEFIMAKALKKKISTIATVGMWGSNHCLSTAAAAKQAGVKSVLLLGPQPVTEDVKKKLLSFHALGAELKYYGSEITLGFGIAKHFLRSKFQDDYFYVPPGGTSREGSLGYVEAFFELLSQTGVEGLPKEIVVPVGTAGTAAGLLVGSCLAGTFEKITIVGVGTKHGPLSNEGLVRKTAEKLYRYIRKNLSKEHKDGLIECDFKKNDKAFVYHKEYSPPGYGAFGPQVVQGMRIMQESEGITLDTTYSGKAFRYFLDRVEGALKRREKIPKILFWHTYNAYPLEHLIDTFPWTDPTRPWLDLPSQFHKLYL